MFGDEDYPADTDIFDLVYLVDYMLTCETPPPDVCSNEWRLGLVCTLLWDKQRREVLEEVSNDARLQAACSDI